ncbi:hypothetical protein AXF42_Ash004495 [Apostasia shenzhenica]|uniref:Uncharacterized protein n=1 Tax=Apostasia shenzhenica TaxID=1088818 RepID=A0A2I0BGV9_9ASPA|nr:hypothetical protein AXF42_Ash004495 [Apostasia shenzhenica]
MWDDSFLHPSHHSLFGLEACQEPASLPALFGHGRHRPTSFRLVCPRTTSYYGRSALIPYCNIS